MYDMLTGRMTGLDDSRGATPRPPAAARRRVGAFRTRMMPYQSYSIAGYPAEVARGAARSKDARTDAGGRVTARRLRLVPADAEMGESTPAERIRMAARRLGVIGREMAAHAEELRALTASYDRIARPAADPAQRGGGAGPRGEAALPALRALG